MAHLDRFVEPIDRKKIRLVMYPYWIRVGPYPNECDLKDLMHAVGSTFGGLLSFDVTEEYCRIKVRLNVKNVLRRGIFVVLENGTNFWILFMYENLLIFCYGCGRMVHNMQERELVLPMIKDLPEDEYPFSLALRAESKLFGKESARLGAASQKIMKQCSYEGDGDPIQPAKLKLAFVTTELLFAREEVQFVSNPTRELAEASRFASDSRDFRNLDKNQISIIAPLI